ncbi:MAG TPA: hypothetical protein VKR26_14280, partial [Terriglobales bacterium]|nr:hypothetical protein [Terriglobales bacterium]
IRSKFGDVLLTSLPFVLLHYMALAAAIAAGGLVFDLMTRVSLAAGWALLAIAAGYFAYADFLYITRLAAYVSLAVPGSEPSVVPEPVRFPSPDVPSPAEGELPATSC